MHILTNSLLRLNGASLPLPWYHRAALGLMSSTPVHVALQAPGERPYGDLLISIVDPARWPFVAEIRAARSDGPGLLANVFHCLAPLNGAVAEAVTIDSGSRHETCLIVEPVNLQPVSDEVERIGTELRAAEFVVESKPVYPVEPQLVWMEVGRIEHGWAHVEGWREALAAQGAQSSGADRFDRELAVVSASPEQRVLRYVFPRRGAISVSVKHTNEPGAMAAIAKALAGQDLNILSLVVRRGAMPIGKAEALIVVEPISEQLTESETKDRVGKALTGCRPRRRVSHTVFDPIDPESKDVLYPRRPHEIAIRPAPSLAVVILAVKAELPNDKRPIFISRRFVEAAVDQNESVIKELRAALFRRGFIAVEGTPEPGAERTVSDQIKAKMWASEAAIVLVLSSPDKRVFSENLAHELGFMQGQGKPLLPLVEAGVADDIMKIANLQGLQLTTFTKESALDRDSSTSIDHQVGLWLQLLPPDVGSAATSNLLSTP